MNLIPVLLAKKITLALISAFLSCLVIGLTIETGFRIWRLGIRDGLRSYISRQTPYAMLGARSWVVHDPDLGYRLNSDLPDINRFFMKDHEVVVPKPDGLRRIVILGDSVPYSGNPTMVDQLKMKFKNDPNTEVLNASVPGYTAYQELTYLKRDILRLEPDIVVYAYVVNDHFRFLHTFDSTTEMILTEEAKDAYVIHTTWDKFISRSYFLSFLKTRSSGKQYPEIGYRHSDFPWDNDAAFSAAWKDMSWPDMEQWIGEMKRQSEKHHAKFAIIMFPIQDQFNHSLVQKNKDYVLKPLKKMAELCSKKNIRCLNLYPIFARVSNTGDSLYVDGLHLSSQGHAVSAEAVYELLGTL